MRIRESYMFALQANPGAGRRKGCRRWSWLDGSRSHWDIYRSGQGSNGRTVGPNQIGSDRGPDCPHSILDKEVRGRVQEGEAGLDVSKDCQGDEWAGK